MNKSLNILGRWSTC